MASVSSMPTAIKVEARSNRNLFLAHEKNYGDVVEDLYHITPGPDDRFVDCLVVSLTDMPENPDKHEADALSLVQGRFWKIGMHNGRPVWRQEAVVADEACNKERLFLFFDDSSPSVQGWYMATSLKAKRENHAWGKADGSADYFPRVLHCPYWRHTTNKHVAVYTSHEFHGHQLAELQALIDSNEPAADWHKQRPLSPARELHGGPKLRGSIATGKASEPKGQSHGGWMLKAVDLSVAVLTNNWQVAGEMAARYRDHPSAKAIFDRKLSNGKRQKHE